MKKLLLSVLAAASIGVTFAETEFPHQIFVEDFSSPLPSGSYLPDGWVTYGIGKTVGTDFQSYFGDKGEPPYYRVLTIEGMSAAWGCSTFMYKADADEWLVSPVIHVNSDEMVLKFKAVSSGAYAVNRYRVLVSESGQDRETFSRTPLINTSLTGWETMVRENPSFVSLKGYAGKDISLAFVNKSSDAGMLGFTDISIAPYAIEVENLTPSVIPAGSTVSVSANVNVHTPSPVSGLSVHLSTSTGIDKSMDINQDIDINGAHALIQFDGIHVPEEGIDYTLSIVPMLENAEPTVVTGEISSPSVTYPPVVLIEEFTGTWCSNCPRGTAFMNYYHDRYDGHDGRTKAIGIALHSENDPMLMTDNSYLRNAFSISGAQGYPSAFFNRTTLGDPSDEHIVKELGNTGSNSIIRINRVSCQDDSRLTVDFEIENSYSKKNMNQRVAMVVVENNVRGGNSRYSQANGFSGISRGNVVSSYGADLWPYFKPFCEGPNPIPFTDIAYQHVARGIYPDYYGQKIDSACEAEVPVGITMSMDMPGQVNEIGNTAVILILLDGDTGKVLSAAEVGAEDYNTDLSGIQTPSVAAGHISMSGNGLIVTVEIPSKLEIHTADGLKVYGCHVEEGVSEIDVSGYSGMMIVTLSNADGIVSVGKFMR